MDIIALLDKHFPKTEHVIVELYASKLLASDAKLAVFNTARFNYIFKRNGAYELYDSFDGSEYLRARVTAYDFVSIYDISDGGAIRAFMAEYVATASDDALHDDFRGLTGVLES